jgi:hypothetical protein
LRRTASPRRGASALARFVRNRTWRGLISTLLERRIIEQGHDDPKHDGLRRVLRSDRHRIDTLLRQMPPVASVLGSAQ